MSGRDPVTDCRSVRCALCEADDARPLFRPRHSPGPVVRCRRCGLVYVSPRENTHGVISAGPVLIGSPNSDPGSRDKVSLVGSRELALLAAQEADGPALQRNAALALDRIAQHRAPPGRLLDYGCGGGFFLREAITRGWDSFGLEPRDGLAVYARSTPGVTIVADTLRDNTFPPVSFDVITAFQVFEHLPSPSDELGKLYRVLKPGGLILIEVPNIETWSVSVLGKRHRHFVPDHLYFFSPDSLRRLVLKHGFEPVATYFPNRYMTLRHLLEGWGGKTLGSRAGEVMKRLLAGTSLNRRIVFLGVGDIVALLARKPL